MSDMEKKKAEIIVLRDINDKSKEELRTIIELLKDNNNLQKEKITRLETEVARLKTENEEYRERLDQELISSFSNISKEALAVLSIYKMLDEIVLTEDQIRTKLNKVLKNVKVKPALVELKYVGFLISEDNVAYRISDKAKNYQAANDNHLKTVIFPAQSSPRFDAILDRFSNTSRKKVKTLLKMWPQVLLGRAEITFMHGKTAVFHACAYTSEHLLVRRFTNKASPESLAKTYAGEQLGVTVKIPLANLKNEDLASLVSLLKQGGSFSAHKAQLADIKSWTTDS